MTLDSDRLRDMLEHLVLIEEHRPASRDALAADVVLSAAVLRWLEIVGEAAANISEATRTTHPELPWRKIIAMRNRLIHAYPGVDMDLVWGVVERDAPELRRAIEKILEGT